MAYEDLVRLVGPGFHPDTRGNEYTSLPAGLTPKDVDKIVRDAFARNTALPSKFTSPYARAWQVFKEQGWAESENISD